MKNNFSACYLLTYLGFIRLSRQHGAFAMSLVRPAVRVERCVNVTDSLMARPNGTSASATARQHGFQLLLLLKLFSHQSCGHQQLDMLSLLLGRSRPDGQLVKVFSALLVRVVRDDTSQFVVAQAKRVVSMLV